MTSVSGGGDRLNPREVLRSLAAGSYEDFMQALLEDPSLWEWVSTALGEETDAFSQTGRDAWRLVNGVLQRLIDSGWLSREDNETGEPAFMFGALEAALAAAGHAGPYAFPGRRGTGEID